MDNRVVILMSLIGDLPIKTIKEFDKKQNQTIGLSWSNVVIQCSKHMGGVDLLDSNTSRYKSKMRSKKHYFKIFYHLLGVSKIKVVVW